MCKGQTEVVYHECVTCEKDKPEFIHKTGYYSVNSVELLTQTVTTKHPRQTASQTGELLT